MRFGYQVCPACGRVNYSNPTSCVRCLLAVAEGDAWGGLRTTLLIEAARQVLAGRR